VLVAAFWLAACDGAHVAPVKSDSHAALASCRGAGAAEARHGSRNAVLRAAFSTSGASYVSWQRSFHARRAQAIAKAAGQAPPSSEPDQPPDGFAQKHAADAHVYVCYFDGDFVTSLPPGGPPPFNRTIVEVAQDGEAATYLDGYHNVPGQTTLPLDPPLA
jgi:hypothetical protein